MERPTAELVLLTRDKALKEFDQEFQPLLDKYLEKNVWAVLNRELTKFYADLVTFGTAVLPNDRRDDGQKDSNGSTGTHKTASQS